MDDDELPDVSPLSIATSPMSTESPRLHTDICLPFCKSRRSSGSKVISGYVVMKKELGQGAYGKVLLGKEEATGKFVALKKLSRQALLKKREFKNVPGSLRPVMTTALDKVYKEIGIMKQLHHPNVLPLYKVIDDGENDTIMLILEFATGDIMQWDGKAKRYTSKLFAKGPYGGLPLAQIRRGLAELVAGLSYLHSLGVVHRDIKPENLLIMNDGSLKICDFGEADQFTGAEAKEAMCSDSKGTHHFFAPEMCDGETERFSGYKVDIWAAGVTLYSMIFGNVPFFDDDFNTHRLFEIICKQSPVIPKDIKPDSLRAVLEGMLDKNPQTRLSLAQIAQHEFLTAAS